MAVTLGEKNLWLQGWGDEAVVVTLGEKKLWLQGWVRRSCCCDVG